MYRKAATGNKNPNKLTPQYAKFNTDKTMPYESAMFIIQFQR
jgi:hypothetical protein